MMIKKKGMLKGRNETAALMIRGSVLLYIPKRYNCPNVNWYFMQDATIIPISATNNTPKKKNAVIQI